MDNFKLCLVLLLFCGRVLAAGQAQAPEKSLGFLSMSTAIGDDYFDGKDTRARVRRHMRIARGIGVQSLRCAFSWNGIEPEQGKYEFRFWDMLVEEANRAGVELRPYVAYTPEWAARKKQDFWKQPPSDPRTFASLMEKLASRYRGRVPSWELWNEPDVNEYWQGSADEFAAMVIEGAAAVRRGDSRAKVVLGGMSRGPEEFFQSLVAKHQIGRYFDVVALHAYPESWHEERAETVFHEWIPEMKELLAKSGGNPELWLNEMGYADYRYQPNHASLWGTNTYYKYEHTTRYAADFLFKSLTMTAASGVVKLAGWYRIDDFKESDVRMPKDKVHDHLGVERVDGELKPSYQAFSFFNRLMEQPFRPADDEVRAQAKQDSQAVVHAFIREDRKIVVVGWLRSSEYDEVPVHSGMLNDRRKERVTVDLPCTAASVTDYDAIGRLAEVGHAPVRQLKDVKLTGDRVFIGVIECR
jgi:hypothetical protein